MNALTRNALLQWAHLQDALTKRNPKRPSPYDHFNSLTKEERNALLEVRINNFIQDLKDEKIRKFK